MILRAHVTPEFDKFGQYYRVVVHGGYDFFQFFGRTVGSRFFLDDVPLYSPVSKLDQHSAAYGVTLAFVVENAVNLAYGNVDNNGINHFVTLSSINLATSALLISG